ECGGEVAQQAASARVSRGGVVVEHRRQPLAVRGTVRLVVLVDGGVDVLVGVLVPSLLRGADVVDVETHRVGPPWLAGVSRTRSRRDRPAWTCPRSPRRTSAAGGPARTSPTTRARIGRRDGPARRPSPRRPSCLAA